MAELVFESFNSSGDESGQRGVKETPIVSSVIQEEQTAVRKNN
jgi:hypothetical protein